MGPTGKIEKMRITENTKIERKVESIVNDDLKSVESAYLLYQNKQDVYKITTILSSGVLGLEENKKLVPTRWSITTTDDIIAKKLIGEIKNFSTINEYLVFESTYLDNRFVILLMPGNWEFENFETWAPGSNWHQPTDRIIEEYEPYQGRKKYADKQAGAYYSVRLAVSEYLKNIKRQAKVVVFREVGEGYTIPMGVWVVRETVRNAMKTQPKKFNTEKEALEYIDFLNKIKIENYIKKSEILGRKTLNDFI